MEIIMVTKQASYSVDWLRVVKTQEDRLYRSRNELQKQFPLVGWTETQTGMFSYTSGIECEYGGLFWNSMHPEFGVMFNSSGVGLSNMRNDGIRPGWLIELLHKLGWRVSRIDLAMDVYNTGARPGDLYRAYHEGDLATRARKVRLLQERKGSKVIGETFYAGARQSNIMLRVYDKAAEAKQKNRDRIRVEFEIKGDKANAYAHSVVNQGIPNTISALLKDQIIAGMPDWLKSAASLEFDVIAMAATKDTNFEAWFQSTVLPAIEKAIKTGVPDAQKLIENAIKSGKEGHGP